MDFIVLDELGDYLPFAQSGPAAGAPYSTSSVDFLWIAVGFVAQGFCAGGGMHGQMAPYLNERFPTEIRATASAFCYHQGAIFGGFVPLVLTFYERTLNHRHLYR